MQKNKKCPISRANIVHSVTITFYPNVSYKIYGADETRTRHLFDANEALYQMSYSPKLRVNSLTNSKTYQVKDKWLNSDSFI